MGTPAMGADTPGMGTTPGFDAPYSPTGGDGPTPGMGSTPGFASTPGMAPTPYGSAPTPGVDGYGPGGEILKACQYQAVFQGCWLHGDSACPGKGHAQRCIQPGHSQRL